MFVVSCKSLPKRLSCRVLSAFHSSSREKSDQFAFLKTSTFSNSKRSPLKHLTHRTISKSQSLTSLHYGKAYSKCFSTVTAAEEDPLQNLKTLWQTADHFSQENQLGEALKIYNFCLDQIRQITGDQHSYVVSLLHSIGNIYLQMEETQQAQHCIEEALKLATQTQDIPSLTKAALDVSLAQVYKRHGLRDKAKQLYKAALDVVLEHYDEGHLEASILKSKALDFLYADEALPLLESAFAALYEEFGESNIYVFRAAKALGSCYIKQGMTDESEEMTGLAVEASNNIKHLTRMELAQALREHALALDFNSKHKQAIQMFIDCLEVLEHTEKDTRLCQVEVMGLVARCLKHSNSIADAKQALHDMHNLLKAVVESEGQEVYEPWKQFTESNTNFVKIHQETLKELEDVSIEYVKLQRELLEKMHDTQQG